MLKYIKSKKRFLEMSDRLFGVCIQTGMKDKSQYVLICIDQFSMYSLSISVRKEFLLDNSTSVYKWF